MLTDVFIMGWLLFAWNWDRPVTDPGRRVAALVGTPLLFLGLWHGWAMFAPDPIRFHRKLRAVILFDNGQAEHWEPLTADRESWLTRMWHVRNYKYQNAVLCGRNTELYVPLCCFLQKLASDDGRRVISVELYREYRAVNPPGARHPYSEARTVRFFQHRFQSAAAS